MSDAPEVTLTFAIRARVDRSDLVRFMADVNGESVATERYHLGNGRRRGEVAEKWAADERLVGKVKAKQRPRLIQAIERELEAAELRAQGELDARREAEADVDAETDAANECHDGDSDGEERGPSQSELLVRLALEHYRIGVDDHDEAFAVKKDGPNIALMFRGSRDALRASLSRLFRQTYRKTPNASALADALTNLQGVALDALPEPTYLRVAEGNGNIIIDLGTADGRAIVVNADGWRVADQSPVLFRRTALTAALPVPQRGGKPTLLRELLNVTDEGWPVLLGWIVAAFLLKIAHAILMLGGEAGSGKSTLARMLIGLFDPSSAPLRSQPDDVERWVMAANGSWGVAIDNVSSIRAWWSDSLCKAVTDDGWVRRKLYTDGELSVISFRRVIILTSIDAGALRGDLGDRLLLCDLERIAEDRRRGETELTELYGQRRPLILGALLDLLSNVLRVLPTVTLPTGPRMYDFARVLAAMDKVLGTSALDTFVGQRERIAEDVVEADPVAKAIVQLIDDKGPWSGTMGELLAAISPNSAPRSWPDSPRKLSGRVKHAATAMRNLGIEVERDRRPGGKRDRIVTIRRSADSTVPIVPTVPNPHCGAQNHGLGGTMGDDPGRFGGCDRPAENPAGGSETAARDSRDVRDGCLANTSDDDSDARHREASMAAEAGAAAIQAGGGDSIK